MDTKVLYRSVVPEKKYNFSVEGKTKEKILELFLNGLPHCGSLY
jgi:hypothetical protein